MSTRDQNPKKKKLKRSYMQDYAVVDSPYRAPQKLPFTRRSPEYSDFVDPLPMRRKQKHGKPKSKKPAVRRPKNKNAKDPFDYLIDDVVGIIVSLLPVQATETLRRVSKLWKATSEYHNDTRAIRRHFGHLGEGSKSFDNKEAANVHFRRLLYHQESLRAGFATRALQCSGAKFWHINNGTLIWASSGGSVSLRRLRSKNSCQSGAEETHELDLRSIWPHMQRTTDCQITGTGEILALVDLYRTQTTDFHTILAKLLPGGTVMWQEQFSGLSSGLKVRAAVGREAIYTIEGREGQKDAKSEEHTNAYFVARSLIDGKILHQRHVQPLDGEFHDQSTENDNLQLTSSEKWIVFKKKNREVHMFATTDQGTLSYGAYAMSRGILVRSKIKDQVWVVGHNFRKRFTSLDLLSPREEVLENQGNPMVDRYFICTRNSYGYGIGFDPDRTLLFRIFEDPLPVIHVINLKRDEKCVHHLWDPQDDIELRNTLIKENYGTPVTLPARLDKETGSRRALDIFVPWTTKDTDYYGIMDDYLVYHSSEEEMLIVLDFWPVW